jgi:hypothetical protein
MEGRIDRVLFPETLKDLTVEEINSWSGDDLKNYRYFLDTLGLLGLCFVSVNEDDRNPINDTATGRLINAYKYHLKNDEKFNIFFDKIMEMKNAIDSGRIIPPSELFYEETDDDASLVDEDKDLDEDR